MGPHAVASVEDLPALRPDGTWTHSARAPIPEAKAERYLAWQNTKETHGATAEGNQRHRFRRMKKDTRRQGKDRETHNLMRATAEDWADNGRMKYGDLASERRRCA
jgi:hypothetical protein